MKSLTKNEFKTIAQSALECEYGFSPLKKQIILLESNGDGTYILFKVKENIYSFHSELRFDSKDGKCLGVWIGKGTIERETR